MLANEYLEGALWHKQTWTHGGCIFDSRLDVLLSEILKWIYLIDNVFEDFVEDIVDTGTSLALRGDVFDEVTIQFFLIFLHKLANQVQYNRAHTLLVDGQILHVIRQKLPFLLLNGERNLL